MMMGSCDMCGDLMIIGIDPDLVKSGVAIKSDMGLRLMNLTFTELKNLFEQNTPLIKKVVIEAGWLNEKSNFHYHPKQTKAAGERIAKNVGENHATGKLISELAASYGLVVELVRPTRSKYNARDFNLITGWTGRTNQEQRDAAMLIWTL